MKLTNRAEGSVCLSVCPPACFIAETTQQILIKFSTGIVGLNYIFSAELNCV